MEERMNAIETTGTVDEEHELHLDRPLPIAGPARVRVIVMYPTEPGDIEESEWLAAGSSNPAFDVLRDSAEDIYTLADGKPFHDKE